MKHLYRLFLMSIALLLMKNTVVFANEFDGGADEYKPNSTQSIRMKVDENAKLACNGDACVLFGVSTSGDSFTTEFNVGVGNPNGSNQNGSVIVVGGTTQQDNNEPWVNLKIKYVMSSCTQKVLVPQSLYIAMNTYLYALLDDEGGTKKNFAPAEQTMILFYTTIAQQAKGCNGGSVN